MMWEKVGVEVGTRLEQALWALERGLGLIQCKQWPLGWSHIYNIPPRRQNRKEARVEEETQQKNYCNSPGRG